MSKAERARLHARYATMLEELPAEQLGLLDEVVGYHLEQAHLLWMDLGGQPTASNVASRAAAHLGAAGKRALDRWDVAAAANLLGRAAALLPPADPERIPLAAHLATSLVAIGHFDDSQAVIQEVIQATDDGSHPSARVSVLLDRAMLATLRGESMAAQKPDIDAALKIAESSGDLRQLARARTSLGDHLEKIGRPDDARRELELAVDAAQRAGDIMLEGDAHGILSWLTLSSSSPAPDIDRVLAEDLAFARAHSLPVGESFTFRAQALEAARRGQFPEARRLMAASLAIADDYGLKLSMASTSVERGVIEFLDGDAVARERVLREGYEQLKVLGERGLLSTVAADLADALIDVGRIDDADAMCAAAAEAGADDDIVTQVRVKLVRARLAAAGGDLDGALVSVADALAEADRTDYYDLRTMSRLVSADLLLLAGRSNEARTRAEELVELARVRGDIVFEAKAASLIERAAVVAS